jgi:hypothetical protein
MYTRYWTTTSKHHLLLGKNLETNKETAAAREGLGKHVTVVVNTGWTVLSARAVTRDNQVSSVRESVKKRDTWKGSPVREDLSAEGEESPLLEAVTRERLVKTAGWKI